MKTKYILPALLAAILAGCCAENHDHTSKSDSQSETQTYGGIPIQTFCDTKYGVEYLVIGAKMSVRFSANGVVRCK